MPKEETDRLVFNMIAKVGYPNMTTYDWVTYLLIKIDKDLENNDTTKVSDINGISNLFTKDIPDSPINSEQKLVVYNVMNLKIILPLKIISVSKFQLLFSEKDNLLN